MNRQKVGSVRTARRFFAVCWAFLPLLWAAARDRHRWLLVGPPRRRDRRVHERRADQLVDILIDLGPAFIKLGQLLSTRPDVVPPVYIERLARLQDDVPPAPWDETVSVIEDSLGPVDERFDAFDRDAISGASLGQVYRASVEGSAVAVKVRRPGVTMRVETDLRVLAVAVPLLLRLLGEAQRFSLANLADEFARVIREEMDYERERGMLEEIGANFADDHNVRIPTAIETHCTDRVLTMEYVRGTKITDVTSLDAQGIDRSAVAERLERAYLQMVLEDGVFHADPHPGNLAVQEDGSIVFYDFGMSGRIDATTKAHIVEFYLAVAERNITGIMDALVALGTLSPDADRRVMGEVLELAIRDASGEQIEEWRIQQIVRRVESTMYEFPLRLPAELALVLRVGTVAEGVCITLDPDFDFVAVATAYLREAGYREESIRQLATDTSTQLARAGLAAIRTAPTAERVLDRLDRDEAFVRAGIEDPQQVLDRLARRLIYGMVLAASLVAAAIVYVERGVDPIAIIAFGVAVVCVAVLIRSFRRGGIHAQPKFTRHELRRRREK